MTGLHLATVGFSARNALAEMGDSTAPEVWNRLLARWNREVELGEVQAALAKLVAVGLVTLERCDHFRAVAPVRFTTRGANGRKMLADDDPAAWEGWS
jgi:hypothetical protein